MIGNLTASYFVVAHFHYVIVGGILFSLFAAFYYWYPKLTGRMLSETLGKWHFWVFLIGFHLTFDFMHIPGLLGMPRRVYTYEAGRGWETWNLISSIGAIVSGGWHSDFRLQHGASYFQGAVAGDDPWDAWTLEWATTSPPPEYNFARIPRCTAAGRCGTSSIPRTRIGSMSKTREARTTSMSASPSVLPANDPPWVLPSRGRVGMISLIIAESAIFLIFVVGLRLLHRQKPGRADAKADSDDSDLRHDLPAFEQPNHACGHRRSAEG